MISGDIAVLMMLYLSSLYVAVTLALVPSSIDALKDGDCEGECMYKYLLLTLPAESFRFLRSGPRFR